MTGAVKTAIEFVPVLPRLETNSLPVASTENPYDALLRLDTPGPGIAALGAHTYPGGPTMVAMNLYLYGDQAAERIARETPVWAGWMQERFSAPAGPS